MKTSFKIVAKTLQGLEDVLATELQQIGITDIVKERRGVSFSERTETLYKQTYIAEQQSAFKTY